MFFSAKRKVEATPVSQADVSMVGVFFENNAQYAKQTEMIGLEKNDLEKIRQLKPAVEKNLSRVVDDFYGKITSIPTLLNIIEKHSSLTRLKGTLTEHIREMFNGRIDDQYVQKRLLIAKKHVQIGLGSKWYMASFQNLQSSLYEVVCSLRLSQKEEIEYLSAVNKLINLEQQIVLEEYDKYSMQLIELEQNKVRQEVKSLIGNISVDLKMQAEETNEMAGKLISGAEHMNKNLSASMDNTNMTKTVCSEGRNQIEYLKSHHEEIEERTSRIAEMVNKLADSTNEIYEVIQIVDNIAIQTNLLALNSSIEAARAGAYGKGFSVVADEIRKLANETKSSVEKIAQLIDSTSEDTEHVVDAIAKIKDLSDDGLRQSSKTNEMFDRIAVTIDQTVSDFEKMMDAIDPLVNIIGVIEQSSDSLHDKASTLDDTIQRF